MKKLLRSLLPLAAILAVFLIAPPSCKAVTVMTVTGKTLAASVASCDGTNTAQYPFSYQWYHNGVAIPGATGVALPTGVAGLANSAFLIASLSPTDAGTYHVTVTNAFGSTSTPDDTLTFGVPPGSATTIWYVNGVA